MPRFTKRTNGLETCFGKNTIVQCHPPTDKSSNEDKDNLYEQLNEVMRKIKEHIAMGDLSAKVENDNEAMAGVFGELFQNEILDGVDQPTEEEEEDEDVTVE
ncbi:hypothetical protein HHI36_009101 [Cryptolaemus montrouzieri]|uniref:Uncharacterized protein n=1 Tax=Cryptolaemus montrouzieri TaxID=559131 RepID=A0ABD2MUA0_9CUCU